MFGATVVDAIERIPGVEEAGLIDALPLGRNRTWDFLRPEEAGQDEGEFGLFPHIIGPGYLSAMRIGLVAGRNISRDDAGDAPLAILMNESGARRVFAGENPLGRHIGLWDGRWWEVVGITEDVPPQAVKSMLCSLGARCKQ